MFTRNLNTLKISTKYIFPKCMSSVAPQKWDLFTAVCVERQPIITPQLNKIELEFQKLLNQMELERSLKSDHEMKHEDDVRQAARLKLSKDIDLDVSMKQTAQDFEDAAIEELSKFQLASPITDADKNNKTDTTKRKLDQRLLLFVEQQVGEQKFFLPPQGMRQDGESLQQTAERVLRTICGNTIKAQFYGNAPSGFYKYKYPHKLQKNGESIGAKVFIYWAKYIQGQVENKEAKFHWLNKQEMRKYLPNGYNDSLAQFLIEDNH